MRWPWTKKADKELGRPEPEPGLEAERRPSIQLLYEIAKMKLKTPEGIGKVALYASSYCRDRLRNTYTDEIPMPRHLVEVMRRTLEATSKELLKCDSSSDQSQA